MKHFCWRTEEQAGKPTVYVCPCGYKSTNAKEFTSVSNPSLKDVTCEVALQKLSNAVLIVKG